MVVLFLFSGWDTSFSCKDFFNSSFINSILWDFIMVAFLWSAIHLYYKQGQHWLLVLSCGGHWANKTCIATCHMIQRPRLICKSHPILDTADWKGKGHFPSAPYEVIALLSIIIQMLYSTSHDHWTNLVDNLIGSCLWSLHNLSQIFTALHDGYIWINSR